MPETKVLQIFSDGILLPHPLKTHCSNNKCEESSSKMYIDYSYISMKIKHTSNGRIQLQKKVIKLHLMLAFGLPHAPTQFSYMHIFA